VSEKGSVLTTIEGKKITDIQRQLNAEMWPSLLLLLHTILLNRQLESRRSVVEGKTVIEPYLKKKNLSLTDGAFCIKNSDSPVRPPIEYKNRYSNGEKGYKPFTKPAESGELKRKSFLKQTASYVDIGRMQ